MPETLPPVLGDEPALRRVFQNLVGNAIKYGAQAAAGSASKRARGRHARSSSPSPIAGIGIAAAEQARIFEPFYRAPDVIAAQIQGAGLGLSLVQRIVEAHGGRITVAAAPRQRQRVHRPAAGCQREQPRPRATRPPPDATASVRYVKRILLVEDEPGLVLTLSDRLDARRLRRRDARRRRERARARRRRSVRPRPARRHAAAARAASTCCRSCGKREHRDAGHHAHRARPGRRQGRRPEARRRRLRHQAVRDDGAARAHRSQAAPRAGRRRIRPRATSSATSASTSARPRSRRTAQPLELSAREFQLLKYFIEHRGATLTREELLNEVWGYNSMPSTRTVDVHVAWLRQKIEPNPRHPQYILTDPRNGV